MKILNVYSGVINNKSSLRTVFGNVYLNKDLIQIVVCIATKGNRQISNKPHHSQAILSSTFFFKNCESKYRERL